MEGSGCGLIWGTMPMFGKNEESHEKPQNSRSPGQDLNLELPKYKAKVLITQPRRSSQFWITTYRQ
jgi:hypothetical protein